MFGFHVAVFPGLFVVFLGIHLLLVQRQGMSVPINTARRLERGERIKQMPFFPDYLLRDVLVWYIALALLAALSAFYPWELGRKADPFAAVPPGIRPEWYFLAMFHTLKLLPSHVLGLEGEQVGVIGFGLAAVLLVLVPFIARRTAREEESSPLFTALGLAALAYFIVFTIIGYRAE